MNEHRSPEELQLMWALLYKDFETTANLDVTDEEMASEFLELILWRERIRRGVEGCAYLWPKVDELTLNAMKGWDTAEYDLLVPEKFFKLLAKGDNLNAIQLIKKAIKAKSAALTKQLTEISRKDRITKHPLTRYTEEIVSGNPNISTVQLKKQLFKNIRQNEILDLSFSFENSSFIPSVGSGGKRPFREVPFADLHKYLYRAKIKITP